MGMKEWSSFIFIIFSKSLNCYSSIAFYTAGTRYLYEFKKFAIVKSKSHFWW